MLSAALLSLLLGSLPALALPSPRTASVGAANSTISWSLCPDTPNDARNTTFYCSSLKVPLNWLDPKEGVNADLFLRMYPADEGVERKGSLLLNAGGPGGSTSAWIPTVAGLCNSLSGGAYDIIGMDPRGVNLTYPNVRAHASDYQADLFNLANPQFTLDHDPTLPFDASNATQYAADLAYFDAMDRRADLKVKLIEARTTEDERRSISTAFVARDFAALVDALGEPDGLLTYYGVSYGTIIGATFAAMFPEKVGRMVLDGVVDAEAYYNDWQTFVETAVIGSDEVSNEFCRLCAKAGPTRCALASNETGLSPEDGTRAVEEKVRAVIHNLYDSPLPIVSDSNGFASFVTASDAYYFYRTFLYSPSTWPTVATAFASALQGNGSLLRELSPIPDSLVRGDRSLANENVFNRTTENTDGVEVTQAISCIDQDQENGGLGAFKDGTNDQWVEYATKVRAQGWTTTELVVGLLHGCRSFRTSAFERYGGPFSVADGLRPLKNKILFASNTLDPITPLVSAKLMADRFGEENASLLIQNGRGHTAILTDPSLCTIAALQAYLQNGTLPATGTVCETDEERVFPVQASAVSAAADLAVGEVDPREAVGGQSGV